MTSHRPTHGLRLAKTSSLPYYFSVFPRLLADSQQFNTPPRYCLYEPSVERRKLLGLNPLWLQSSVQGDLQ